MFAIWSLFGAKQRPISDYNAQRVDRTMRLIGEKNDIEISSSPGSQFIDVSRRRRIGIARDETRDLDLVCLPCQTVLDASSRGIPDRLDGPLHLDGRQLLEALGDGAAISSALKGDGLVPGTTCAQRCVVAGLLRLARH